MFLILDPSSARFVRVWFVFARSRSSTSVAALRCGISISPRSLMCWNRSCIFSSISLNLAAGK